MAIVVATTPFVAKAASFGSNPTVSSGTFDPAVDTFTGTLTIATGGSITLSANASLAQAFVFTGNNTSLTYSGTPRTLTITSSGSFTRSGAGTSNVFDHIVDQGSFAVTGGTLSLASNATFNNQATLMVSGGGVFSQTSSGSFTNGNGATASVSGSGSTLAIFNAVNSGTLSADTNGLLQLYGTFTTANLGTINLATGGAVEIDGTLDNTGGTLNAPNGGAYALKGAIMNGHVDAAAITAAGGTLDGAVINGTGNVSIGTNTLTLKNAAGYTGTATVGVAGQNGGQLILGSDLSTQTGSATVLTGSNTFVNNTSGTNTLTVVSGSALQRTGAGGYTTLFTNLTNQGTVTIDGGTLYSSRAVTNQGVFTVSNGAAFSQASAGSFANASGKTATATGAGSTLAIYNPANAGTLAADTGGLIQLYGSFPTSALGTITLATGGSVEIDGAIDNNLANLTAPSGGSYVFKGTITNGTIASSALAQNSGTLDHATINGNVTIGTNTLTLKNGAGYDSTTTVGIAGQNGGQLILGSDLATLTGSTTVLTGSNTFVNNTSGTNTLTIAAGSTLNRTDATGYTTLFTNLINQGTTSVDGGTLYSSRAVTNQGAFTVSNGATFSQTSAGSFTNTSGKTATVTGAGSVLAVYNVANSGTLAANTNGLLQFYGSFPTSALGTVSLATGGAAEIDGIVDNTNGPLNAPGGGSYIFKGTITNGTIASNALTQYSGTLDNATITGNVAIGTNTLTLKNNAGYTGTATVGIAGQNGGQLILGSALSTQASSATVLTGTNSFVNNTSGTNTLTIVASSTLNRTGATGYTTLFTNLTNQGTATIDGGTLYSSRAVTNQGAFTVSSGAAFSQTGGGSFTNASGKTATVTGAGSTLAVYNVANSGTLAADTSGLIQLYGNYATANLGAITLASGGAVQLFGTLDNTSAALAAPSGGSYGLNGTILNGTIASNAFTAINGTLDGATVNGNFSVPGGASAGSLTLKNGATFNGIASIGTTGQNGGFLYFASHFATPASSAFILTGSNSQITYASGGPYTLTLSANSSLTRSGAGNSSITDNVVNQGTLAVTGGTLFTNGTISNQAAASVSSGATWTSSGSSFQQTAGTLQVDGALGLGSTTLALQGGTFAGAGTITGNVAISGGTIAPGNNGIGTLTLANGTFAITGATIFAADLGGAGSDQLVFQNPTGVVNLGSGLVTLSLNLTSVPTYASTYNLVRISSGGSGISGTFAGLPNSGDLFSSTFGGTPYFFSVNYQANTLSLLAVPEPSTYALLGVGLALLPFLRRKRR